MGTILDSPSIIFIIVPLILPVMKAFEVDLIWFGIVTIIAVEIGLLTPPLGIACFTIKPTWPTTASSWATCSSAPHPSC